MDGILLLNKPQNMTSHDCVNQIRKIFHTKKVGHLGTLDPDVTGVLPLCINQATKIIQFLDKADKEYIAEIKIGYKTSTEDASGEIIERNDEVKTITREEILKTLKSFLGKQKQIPPMISAVKVNGKKLYEYAKENKEVERPVREIEFYAIELLSKETVFTGKEITFSVRVSCSKGTYIRTLAVDIGKKLGYPAHMSHLIRSKSGHFELSNCFTFPEIKEGNYQLISLYDALETYPRIVVNDDIKSKIQHGQKLKYELNEFTFIVFCDIFKQVLAIYERDPKNADLIKPVRVLNG